MTPLPGTVRVLTVTGPTATGKTALAVKLAREFHGEIVSVDSRQVYRGMDLGTGKDRDEYGEIPVHLLDVADPAREVYNLSCFCRDAFAAITAIARRGNLPVLCGGTALYLDALLSGYRLPGGERPPRDANGVRPRQDRSLAPSFTPPFALDSLTLGVRFPRTVIRQRIRERLDRRFDAGMIDEVRRLHDEAHVSYEQLEFFGLEYREIARFLQGQYDFPTLRETLALRIGQFAKRQEIFFRKIEREGKPIFWVNGGDFAIAKAWTDAWMKNGATPSL